MGFLQMGRLRTGEQCVAVKITENRQGCKFKFAVDCYCFAYTCNHTKTRNLTLTSSVSSQTHSPSELNIHTCTQSEVHHYTDASGS